MSSNFSMADSSMPLPSVLIWAKTIWQGNRIYRKFIP
jgi:hypothetical protein